MNSNETARRIAVLQKILQNPKFKCINTSSKFIRTDGNQHIQINQPPPNLHEPFNVLFTPQSLTFLSEIVSEFDERIDQLHWNREYNKVQTNLDKFKLPVFSNTSQRLDKSWKIKPLPRRLLCRHIDLGDVSPYNTDHFFGSLKTDVQGVQVDFDDGHCPTWKNQIIGLYNVYRVVHGLVKEIKQIDEIPILMLRPRAWNMTEHNIMINGKKVPGPLVDFAILMFHNARILSETESGPFFYLSKLEGASEAKLWNDIFIWTQNRLNIPYGTVKACVLIENILSSFQMDEILFELKDHSLGLNCGIWDYAASIISKFGNNPDFILPDRNKYVNMDRHFLRKYMELVIQTSHLRGAPVTGGMTAQLLSGKTDYDTKVIANVVKAKTKEINAGCDGFLIYDIQLIPHMQLLWASHERNNEITNKIITEQDLLKIPTGSITVDGLKHNIQVAILFIYNWLHGNGHFTFKRAVEDSATAEISRSQVWQWIRHLAKIEHDGETVTKALVEQMSVNFIKECVNLNSTVLEISKELFMEIVTARYFVDFITTYLSDSYIFKKQQRN